VLGLEIEFLTGRYAATAYNDRYRAEWPPHPARVYSALVAAHYDDPEPDPAERRALEWLESAGPPVIEVSSAAFRGVTDVFVPVNDVAALPSIDNPLLAWHEALDACRDANEADAKEAAKRAEKARGRLLERSAKTANADGKGSLQGVAELLPGSRNKQPRTFAVAVPEIPLFRLCWDMEPAAELAEALDRVAERVARLGHSSSLVRMRVRAGDLGSVEGLVRWEPDATGEKKLRIVSPGQLARLDQAYEHHRAVEARILPASFSGYRARVPVDEITEPARSTFAESDWILFSFIRSREDDSRTLLHISRTEEAARALRGAILQHGKDPLPESISGHTDDGGPTRSPHVAWVPLADVGHEWATGSLLGVAIVPPSSMAAEDRIALYEAIAAFEAQERGPHLRVGRLGVLALERKAESRRALQPETWTQATHRWATVTAIALDRNPGNLRSREPEVVAEAVAAAERSIANACEATGLPRPVEVHVLKRSLFTGAPAAHRFMPFPRVGNGLKRVCVHAALRFAEPVRGPVLLGAGRYFGLGLCRPFAGGKR